MLVDPANIMTELLRFSRPRSWQNIGQVSHTVLAKAARLRLFGKHPGGFYFRLNKKIWEIISGDVRNSYLISAYGASLHGLARLVATRRQYFRTFFLRNRPALELMRRLADERPKGSTLRIAVLGCSIGAEVYSILWIIRLARPDLKVLVRAVDISREILNFAEKGIYSPDTCELVDVLRRKRSCAAAGLFNRLLIKQGPSPVFLDDSAPYGINISSPTHLLRGARPAEPRDAPGRREGLPKPVR